MLLQIIGLWAIVGLVVVWFVKDEQKRRDAAQRELAASYAQAPRRKLAFEKPEAPQTVSMWRDQPAVIPVSRQAPAVSALQTPTPVRRPVMSEAQLRFIAELAKPQIAAQD